MTTEKTDFAIPFSRIKELLLIQELNFNAEKIGFPIIEYFAEVFQKIFHITKSV
jgi:hypothetical protein